MKLNLTDFQRDIVVSAMQARIKASDNEAEALKMVFKAHDMDVPKSGSISIDNNVLTFEGPAPSEPDNSPE